MTAVQRTFRAMNTEWCVRATPAHTSTESVEAALAAAEALVHVAEARYSRFRDDSLLAELNRVRLLRDPGFAAVARAALHFVEATRGAFDPTIGAALAAAGYDLTFEGVLARETAPATWADARRPRLVVRGDTVALEGDGTLDLGGIAKGWTVDRAGEALEARGIRDYLVDGGAISAHAAATPARTAAGRRGVSRPATAWRWRCATAPWPPPRRCAAGGAPRWGRRITSSRRRPGGPRRARSSP